jgi:hypothetical protein
MFACCFRRKNKQEPTTRSVALQSQQQPHHHDPLVFPDAVNECLSSLLRDRDKQKLSAVSRAVSKEFGGKLEWVTLRWRGDRPTASLLALLKRQERLDGISVSNNTLLLLPPLLNAISHRYFPFLIWLSIYDWSRDAEQVPTSFLSTLAGLIEQGALDSLERLTLRRCEKGGVEILMEALKAGGCPNLEYLHVPLEYYFGDEEI